MSINFRARDFFYPLQIWRARAALRRSESQDPGRLRAWQEERLRLIIRHCWENVPFYRKRWGEAGVKPSDIRGLDDLPKLPILCKDDLRKHSEELAADNWQRFRPRWNYSSGSTGTPVRFYLDGPSNAVEFASYWWHWGWFGYRLGDRFATIRATPFTTRTSLRGKLWHFDCWQRALYLNSTRFSPESVDAYAKEIHRRKPRFLKVRPTVGMLFARALRERGIREIRMEAIFSGGMNLVERDARVMSEVFGCGVYDSYGQMERVVNIRQCENRQYHVNMLFGVLEIIDDRGDPVPAGTPGRMIGTGLHNLAMPLIRYDTRDICAFSQPSGCACGRSLPRIESLYGFMEDVVVSPDGRYLSGLGTALKHARNIRLGQIVQVSRRRIEVRLVKDAEFEPSDGEQIMQNVRRRVGEGMEVVLVFVSSIPPTEAGKFKWVISEVAADVCLS